MWLLFGFFGNLASVSQGKEARANRDYHITLYFFGVGLTWPSISISCDNDSQAKIDKANKSRRPKKKKKMINNATKQQQIYQIEEGKCKVFGRGVRAGKREWGEGAWCCYVLT